MPDDDRVPSKKRRIATIALVILAIAAPAMVIVPIRLILPFKAQTAAGLAISFTLRRVSPIATILALALAIAIAAWLWKDARRWWKRAALVASLVPIAAAAWVARVNLFEKMFTPLPGPAYAHAAEASFVADGDMVLAYARGADRAAYPVRQIAYHHVVEDVVGDTPIVITY